MPISPLADVFLANDKYRGQLRSTWIASPADTTLAVTAVPTNVPTYVVVGWETDYETVFSITGKSGSSAANYALTGVTRVKGANANIPENTPVNCLNNEEFFNQYESKINDAITQINDALLIVDNIISDFATVTDAASMEFDLADGQTRKFKCTLGGNRTFTIANPATGVPFIIRITMDGTARTVTWFTGYTIKWQGTDGATNTAIAASKVGTYGFIVTGASTMDGFFMGAEE